MCAGSVALAPPGPGDSRVAKDSAFGGSHLLDVTVIRPVFNATGCLPACTGHRAHHAEIGGNTTGSMPALAKNPAEVGVVPQPMVVAGAGRRRHLGRGTRIPGGDDLSGTRIDCRLTSVIGIAFTIP